jgi:hypothetical protein
MFLATLPGLAFIVATMAVLSSFLHEGPAYGFLTTLIGGGMALVLYAVCARLLKVDEFKVFMRTVAGRLGR